jgi:hypothetical protein
VTRSPISDSARKRGAQSSPLSHPAAAAAAPFGKVAAIQEPSSLTAAPSGGSQSGSQSGSLDAAGAAALAAARSWLRERVWESDSDEPDGDAA